MKRFTRYTFMVLFAFVALLIWPQRAALQQSGKGDKGEKGKAAEKTEPADAKSETDTDADAGSPPSDSEEGKEKPGSEMSAGTYTVRLTDLEDRINRLKEQVFRSKARLSLLAETVLDKKIAGAKSSIFFRNKMGSSFRLVKALFLLDGGPIFNKTDNSGNLAERKTIDLFDGPVMPGEHTLSIVLSYRGHGYGVFSYLKGYSFKVRSSHTFTVGEGKALKLEVVGYEKGGVTTPLEERPAVKYVEDLTDYEGEAAKDDQSTDAKGETE